MRALWRMNESIDVRDLLANIQVETLVLHRKDDIVRIERAQQLAASIPGEDGGARRA